MRRIGGEPGSAKGTHRTVSAVIAEIDGGTLPEKRFSPRYLRRSVPVQHAPVGREDRTGGGGTHSATSRVSAVMLARIGPVKPFLPKCLIAHSEACGRAEDEPLMRSPCPRAATQAPRRRRARPREGGAQPRERGQRGDRRRHAAGEAVLAKVPATQYARSARASRSGDRTGGGAAYSTTSLVSAGMLAEIGPVKPFWPKSLTAQSEACGRAENEPPALAKRRMHRIGGEPGRAKGTHRNVSAVSAEIVGGTLPTRPG
jgi:hypothetical protein